MATMTFQVNDASTGGGYPAVWVSITENADGTLAFNISQQGGIVGDLRGLFFDIADESLLKSIVVRADSSDIRIGDDSIKDLGDGANMNGLLGSDKGYDVGIEIGTSGIGKDDVRSYSFTLDSTLRDLTLQDFTNVDFGARLTSVGVINGSRTDSSKIMETTSEAINLSNATASVMENAATSGNVLGGVDLSGATTVTDWSGGTVGSSAILASDGDTIGTLVLNADGSYVLDASMADRLSAGESIVFDMSFDARNQDEATSWSTDSASFTVTINGVYDGPDARDDAAATDENGTPATGSVIANDSDVDRLDTISVASWSGGMLGEAAALDNGAGATFKLNADGSYMLDASSADALSAGEVITRQFTYTLADNHGATDTASISVSVTGVNDGPDARDDAGGTVKENAILSGSVTANDSDVDRLDTHTWALIDGSFDGQGSLTFNTDGTWNYDAKGAYDGLMEGDQVELSFDYLMTDNYGASDMATVTFTVEGAGNVEPPPPPPSNDMFPGMQQAISNVVLYLDDGDAQTALQKVKLSPAGEYFDVDDLKIGDFIATHSGADSVLGNNTSLVGISVHAGQEYPNVNEVDGTRPGEGAFYYLMDGEDPSIAAVGHRDAQGGWTLDWANDDYPLTAEALAAGFSDQLLNAPAQNFAYIGIWV